MPLHVVLVEPQYPGNVGAVARVMLNFGVDKLTLVKPCAIDNEARDRAVHAQRVLDEAVIAGSFAEVAERMDFIAAFAARSFAKDRSHLRNPVYLRDFAPKLRTIAGDVALVFGREDDGLSNEEVALADVVIQIPTSPAYKSMNLSHAVGVAMYELFATDYASASVPPASEAEKAVLFKAFAAVLEAIELPEHRKIHTETMFRRVIGRAVLSKWEYHRLMGVQAGVLKRLKRWPVKGLAEASDPEDEGHAEEPL